MQRSWQLGLPPGVVVAAFLFGTIAATGAETVERFGLFEAGFTANGACQNPYVDLAAEATLTAPDGRRTRTVPLFWDGGDAWKFRFSPDETGTWEWATRSRDGGLDGRSGRFRVVDSRRRGSLRPMRGFRPVQDRSHRRHSRPRPSSPRDV